MQGRVSWLFRRLRATTELQQIISTSTIAPRVISSQKFCIRNKSCTMQPLLYGACISNKMMNGNRESTIKTRTSKIGEMTSYHIGRQKKNNLKVFQMCLRIHVFCYYVNNYQHSSSFTPLISTLSI